jgi:hypothetical protein
MARCCSGRADEEEEETGEMEGEDEVEVEDEEVEDWAIQLPPASDHCCCCWRSAAVGSMTALRAP